ARDALGVGDDVVHVAGVVRAVVHASVRGARRVEVPARAGRVGRAAVAGLVHVEAVRAVRRQAADFAGDVHGVGAHGHHLQPAADQAAGGGGEVHDRGVVLRRRGRRGRRRRRRGAGGGGGREGGR